MIDIHTHILPGCDDGASSMEESLEMAAVAVQDGIRQVVATPHEEAWGKTIDIQRVVAAVDDLRRAIADRGIDIEVLVGIEALLAPDLPERLAQRRVLGINEKRYVLVEVPFQLYPAFADQTFFELQLRGIVPVLAHPERNAAVQRDPYILEGPVSRGVMVQITAGSLLGAFGSKTRETAETMLASNLAHVIASDAHSPEARPPILSTAARRAAELVGAERAEAMVSSVPKSIIIGERVELPAPIRQKARKGWPFPQSALQRGKGWGGWRRSQ